MQFMVLAYDSDDSGAYERRKQTRTSHIVGIKQLKSDGHFLDGGALANDSGKTIGSVLLLEFADRQALEDYLRTEPYRIGGVWKNVQVFGLKRFTASEASPH